MERIKRREDGLMEKFSAQGERENGEGKGNYQKHSQDIEF